MVRKPHAWYEVENGTVESVSICGGNSTHFSQRCPTRRTTPNEDAACVFELSDQHGLLAVADGIGGTSSGYRAARAVIEQLISNVASGAVSEQSSRAGILNAIETANRQILEWGIGSGSTLAVVEYLAGRIRTYHVGDTQVLLCSNRGSIKFVTVGHAPVAMAVEIGLLEEQEALHHEDRSLISNCVGSHEMKIEIGPTIPMAARDTLLIASDGLFDNLTTIEVASIIRTGPLTEKTTQLVAATLDRMSGLQGEDENITGPSKPDDLTVVGFRQHS